MSGSAWLALTVILALAVMSPGPDFLAVIRTSLAHGRTRGINVAMGIALGGMLWTLATLLGVVAVISSHPTAFTLVRFLGAAFLALYGVRILALTLRAWRAERAVASAGVYLAASLPEVPGEDTAVPEGSAPQGSVDEQSMTAAQAMRLGFLTNTVGNPKAAIFFSSLFATLIPPTITLAEGIGLTALTPTLAFSWFAAVASLAAIPRLVRAYRAAERLIDTAMGTLFIILGATLIPWASLAELVHLA